MTNAHVKHPILHLEVVAPDGTREPDHVVFCLLHRQFVRVEDCCQCVHYAFIGEGLPPSVDCSPLPPVQGAHDPDGERTDVGSLLSHGTVVVADTVSLGRTLAQLRTSGPTLDVSIPVDFASPHSIAAGARSIDSAAGWITTTAGKTVRIIGPGTALVATANGRFVAALVPNAPAKTRGQPARLVVYDLGR